MEIRPAATVMIARESKPGLEVLLLKRSRSLKFAPGAWVFPGGRIDQNELEEEASLELSAARAAVRETREECGLFLMQKSLFHYCHWTTPAGDTRRFSTWFFHALMQDVRSEVKIDEAEIIDYRWISPLEAIQQQANRQMMMLPPTFISLQRIKNCRNYLELKGEFQRTGIIRTSPVVDFKNGNFYAIYEGDAGYQTGDANVPGPRHRLVGDKQTGLYRFEFKDCAGITPVNGGVEFY